MGADVLETGVELATMGDGDTRGDIGDTDGDTGDTRGDIVTVTCVTSTGFLLSEGDFSVCGNVPSDAATKRAAVEEVA